MGRDMRRKFVPMTFLGLPVILFTFLIYQTGLHHGQRKQFTWKRPTNSLPQLYINSGNYSYDRMSPLIFVGGHAGSGTTLTRFLLDAHPLVRCGPETVLTLFMLDFNSQHCKSEIIGTENPIQATFYSKCQESTAAYILQTVVNNGAPAQRLCNKFPDTALYTVDLAGMFPNSKFLLVIRDGRAVACSYKRCLSLSKWNDSAFKKTLTHWNNTLATMTAQCDMVGAARCLRVYYEQLVLHPEKTLRKIFSFLDLPWDDSVLHHEDYINKDGDVMLKRYEQFPMVINPINMRSLTVWASFITPELKQDMDKLAPMLTVLGYNSSAYPPDYGQPDLAVIDNTKKIISKEERDVVVRAYTSLK